MLEEDIVSLINSLCEAITNKDAKKILSFYLDDASLSWGPYVFKGIDEIKKWALELGANFREFNFKENSLVVRENTAEQKFTAKISMPNGFRGILRGTSKYEFEGEKIKKNVIEFSEGIAVFDPDNIDAYFTKYNIQLMKNQMEQMKTQGQSI
ncbi:MAG: Nuclear transport factor 2 family protein [Thermoproteota archaeon]|nr:Nuclear transport factor 2 family protein [Thermoproteota archaeon]